MSKIDDVRKEMVVAMKAGDKARKETLSSLLAALKNKAIDKREDLTAEEEVQVVLKEIKQTKETLEMTPADRAEIIAECRARIAVLEEFAPKMIDEEDAYAAVCGAGRALGYVCAPSMLQRVIEKCISDTSDISIYKENRDLLYNALTKMGFECVYPDGAFYLFVKAMGEDAYEFCEKAKEYELLLVPANSFGTPGYVRVSYCEKLAESYK